MATESGSDGALYSKATDDHAKRLQSTAITHPAALEFQKRQGVKATRYVLSVQDEYVEHNLTSTTLAGPDTISPPPFVYADDEAGSLLAFYHLGRRLSGHSGLVHGGISAVLLDECMGRASFPRLDGKIAVTANLTLNYKSPIPVDSIILVRADVTEVQGRKAWVRGVIENAEDGQVLVEATGLYIEPKWAASLSKLL
ncbi:hypothetical protein FDECE_16740 [Fusarium decemcellulare]|nr:hypothetical protein FDECE_16740 [Fusarium decemcellulare]